MFRRRRWRRRGSGSSPPFASFGICLPPHGRQLLSHSHYLSKHVRLLRMGEGFRLAGRQRMGLQDQIAVLQGAPGTSVAIPVFDKIYWALVLVATETLVHLTTLHIELHQRAGRDQWVHPPVILTDVTVAKIAGIEAF